MGDMVKYKCVCCGEEVLATKFASALKIKCERCKKEGCIPDKDIVQEIELARQDKKKSKNEKNKTDDIVEGNKKLSKCIKCGAEVWITKFGSHAKTLCENCKDTPSRAKRSTPSISEDDIEVDVTRINRELLTNYNEYYIVPTVIANRNLRKVTCPACKEHTMKIVKLVDGYRGLVMVYQCPECRTTMTLSEQTKRLLVPVPESTIFNYRGEEIEELLSKRNDTIYNNIITQLLGIIKDNNINIDGIEIPSYITKHDIDDAIDKNIPIGFSDDANIIADYLIDKNTKEDEDGSRKD